MLPEMADVYKTPLVPLLVVSTPSIEPAEKPLPLAVSRLVRLPPVQAPLPMLSTSVPPLLTFTREPEAKPGKALVAVTSRIPPLTVVTPE
jgi:hypothetical protein